MSKQLDSPQSINNEVSQSSSIGSKKPSKLPRVQSKKQRISNLANDETDRSWRKIFLTILSISALIVACYIQTAKYIGETWAKKSKLMNDLGIESNTLVIASDMDQGYMDHIIDRMNLFGHKLAFMNSISDYETSFESELSQFDTIWSHDYPFNKDRPIINPRQRFNHFPGSGYITNKISLSTSPPVARRLQAFILPRDVEEFRQISKDKPDKLWVTKTNSHRGIEAKQARYIIESNHSGLVQEFMDNPLLIEGYKFDIGIYAVLTSLNPIRAYIFDEALLRFCSHPYIDQKSGIFNESNIDSYVVGDDYKPIWMMRSFARPFIGLNLGMKRSLNYYLDSQTDLKSAKLWDQIRDIIRSTYKLREFPMTQLTENIQHKSNVNSTSVEGGLNQFFELVRFDFIVDDKLNAYLMEANMSPNLSSKHFPPNRLLYEQVLNSLFNLVGLSQFSKQNLVQLPVHYLDGKTSYAQKQIEDQYVHQFGLDDLISDKDLSVNEELCDSKECHMNCSDIKCRVCFFCLDYSNKLHLRRAIYEHLNRWHFKRLLPSIKPDQYKSQTEEHERLDAANRLHVDWFIAKCRQDITYCDT